MFKFIKLLWYVICVNWFIYVSEFIKLLWIRWLGNWNNWFKNLLFYLFLFNVIKLFLNLFCNVYIILLILFLFLCVSFLMWKNLFCWCIRFWRGDIIVCLVILCLIFIDIGWNLFIVLNIFWVVFLSVYLL